MCRSYPDGKILGDHKGIHHYTYGQRRGLGLSHHEPLFVIRVDASDNSVWLGPEKYLFRQQLEIERAHWHTQVEDGELLDVKIRYAHAGAKARVYRSESGQAKIEFLESQRAITPGQAAVVYRENALVGGGWII